MPLQLSIRREATLLGLAAGFIGLAIYYDRRNRQPVTAGTLRNPSAASNNPLDALAWDELDDRTAGRADIGLYGGPTLPLLLALHPRPRQEYRALLLVWLETILLNFAITSAIKNRASRPRPYVLSAAFPQDRSLSRNDRAAFLSGHSSMAAAGSVLCARLVWYYFPEFPRKKLIFLAAALPVYTAYLRVRSAKHWPSDAVAGLLQGGAVGWWVPHLHLEAGDAFFGRD